MFVLTVSAVKDAIEDYARHKAGTQRQRERETERETVTGLALVASVTE